MTKSPEFSLTLWRTFSRGRREKHTWPSFIDTFVKNPEIVRDKRSVAGFSFAAFDENRRSLKRLENVCGLVLDFDHGKPTVEKIAKVFNGVKGVTYTTFSHTKEEPRFRAVVPHSRVVTAAEHDRIWLWAQAECAKAGLEIDPVARDASHFYFLPSHRPGAEYRYVELEGKTLDVELPLSVVPVHTPTGVSCAGRPFTGNISGEGAPRPRDTSASGRDWHLALKLMREGRSDEEIIEKIRRTSKIKRGVDEAYLVYTVSKARTSHEAYAPCMSVQSVALRCLPARFSYPERRQVELKLMSEDGEIAETELIVPAPWYSNAAPVWAACLPDVDPKPLLGDWEDTKKAWQTIRWRHRKFLVAVRNGVVRWIKAA